MGEGTTAGPPESWTAVSVGAELARQVGGLRDPEGSETALGSRCPESRPGCRQGPPGEQVDEPLGDQSPHLPFPTCVHSLAHGRPLWALVETPGPPDPPQSLLIPGGLQTTRHKGPETAAGRGCSTACFVPSPSAPPGSAAQPGPSRDPLTHTG